MSKHYYRNIEFLNIIDINKIRFVLINFQSSHVYFYDIKTMSLEQSKDKSITNTCVFSQDVSFVALVYGNDSNIRPQ